MNRLYDKVNNFISNYFYEVNNIFNNWKEQMKTPDEVLNYYNSTSFHNFYFFAKGNVNSPFLYEIYAKMDDTPTMSRFVKFLQKYKPGMEKKYQGSNIFIFEEMFLDD